MAEKQGVTFGDKFTDGGIDPSGISGAIDPASAGAGSADSGNSGDAGEPAGTAPYGFRADGTPAKKRGRKPGPAGGSGRQSKSSAKQGNSVSVSGLEKILSSLHAMGAAALSSPELVLDDAEAKTLAEGIAAVQEHYNYTASAETIAWANLVAAMVAVYGPRVYLIHDRKKKERRSKKAPQPQSAASEFDNVYQSIVNPGNM